MKSTAQIFVVGMHRSGTSAITNLLANMGAYFGAFEDSIGHNPENPKGFWERRDVRHVNDFFLHSLSCEWDCLSHWDIDQLPAEVLDEGGERIKSICASMAESGKSFVIKDPRLCLLLPLWLEAASNPIVVYAHRNPVEIAKSLRSRNGFEDVFGLELWEYYSVRALSFLESVPTLYVSYQNIVNDEMGEASRVKSFLMANGASDLGSYDLSRLQGTIDSSLKNQNIEESREKFTTDYQFQLCAELSRRCVDNCGEIALKYKKFSLSDREENINNLAKYSRTKIKYDHLQDYNTSLKARFSESQKNVRSLQRMVRLLKFVAESRVLKVLYRASKTLRFIGLANKFVLAYEESVAQYRALSEPRK